jgi:myo-inositol-1(or 4)-monophosphatase
MSSVPDPSTLRDRARRVAVEAAAAVREGRRAGIGSIATKSSGTDPVTEIDRSTESLIVDRLLAEGPDDAVLGEESGSRDGGSGVRWVIDPIDGTVNFVYGIPAYGVSIGAELSGELVAGVVVDVARGSVCAAARDQGSQGPDGPLTVTTIDDPSQALIGTGFGYRPERRRAQAEVLTRILPAVRDIRRIGSAALDLCAVAAGRLDGFYELGLEPWDLAAGAVLVREAGGTVHELPIEADGATMTVAAGPGLISPLIDLLRDAGAVS